MTVFVGKKKQYSRTFWKGMFLQIALQDYRKAKALDSVIYERILLVSWEFNEIGQMKP